MKHLFFIILLFLSEFAFAEKIRKEADVLNDPKDIIEYFLILPDNAFLGLQNPGETSFQYRKSLLESSKKKTEVQVLTNKSKTFLKLVQNTSFKAQYELSYFPKDLKSDLILVSSKMQHEEGISYKLVAFSYKNKDWQEVTEKVIPNFSFKLFLDEKSKEKISPELDQRLIFHQCIYKIDENKNEMEVTLRQTPPVLMDGDADKYNAILKKAIYKKLILEWNKEKNIFAVSKKL